MASSGTTWWCCLPGEAKVDLAFDVGPFFGLSQPPYQFFKGRGVFGGELNQVRKSKGSPGPCPRCSRRATAGRYSSPVAT